jgi:site-specific DNA-methyltransferase (adenine-specific)
MSTEPNDVVLDPFGGSGTTYVVAESKHRQWIGIEIDYAPEIVQRLECEEIYAHHNSDYVERSP